MFSRSTIKEARLQGVKKGMNTLKKKEARARIW